MVAVALTIFSPTCIFIREHIYAW